MAYFNARQSKEDEVRDIREIYGKAERENIRQATRAVWNEGCKEQPNKMEYIRCSAALIHAVIGPFAGRIHKRKFSDIDSEPQRNFATQFGVLYLMDKSAEAVSTLSDAQLKKLFEKEYFFGVETMPLQRKAIREAQLQESWLAAKKLSSGDERMVSSVLNSITAFDSIAISLLFPALMHFSKTEAHIATGFKISQVPYKNDYSTLMQELGFPESKLQKILSIVFFDKDEDHTTIARRVHTVCNSAEQALQGLMNDTGLSAQVLGSIAVKFL